MATPPPHVALCLFLFCIPPLILLTPTSADQSDNYIVHMDLSAMPNSFSTQHSWYLSTLSSALSLANSNKTLFNLSSKLIYSYQNVINGFTANLSPDELNALKSSNGYISSTPDLPVKRDTTHSPKFLGLNDLAGAWPESNYGQDVIIGVIDTGVWPESRSFNDIDMPEIPQQWKGQCEFEKNLCNKKLIGARSFNKGLLAKNPTSLSPSSVNSTRDTDGHGTHTSSTAAGSAVDGASFFGYAKGTARGVAPRARVAMYKALWEDGSYTSDIIAAIDSAISDGVHVLSLSFGFNGSPLYDDPIAIATFAAMEKGIVVSTSAGNSGPGLGTLHNGTPWVITVAAATMDREFGGTLVLSNKVKLNGLSLYPGNFSAAQIPIVFMGSCDDVKKLIKFKTKIVVCEDNYNTSTKFADQVMNVANAKVIGGVFISNNTDARFTLGSIPFPSILLSPAQGEIVKDFIKKNAQPKASMGFKVTTLGTKKEPSVDIYTSRGPSFSCPYVLKPDVAAPGTSILAAWPSNVAVTELGESQILFNDFNLLSGTSMSCPHVAGIAALVKGAHPDWSPAAVRSAIMTTSDIWDNTLGWIRDIGDGYKTASPLALGSGHVNPNNALDPGLIYDAKTEDYVSLLCALNFTQNNIKSITRSSNYNCSNVNSDLNYPSFIAFFNDANNSKTIIKEFERTVTYVREGPAIYVAAIVEIEGFNVIVTPSTLVFSQKNEKASYKVRIEGSGMMKEEVAFGHLIWASNPNPKVHFVRSPIVVTGLKSQPM